MKLSLFKKVCLTVMGVGVVSSLVSVGTFATFTATATNPGNTFAAGTLLISTVSDVSPSAYSTSGTVSGQAGPNITGTDVTPAGTECTNTVLAACRTIINVNNVTAQGLEPGQYATAQFHVKNTGTLPGAMSVQIENVSTTINAAGGAANSFSICPSQISALRTATGQTGLAAACTQLGDGLNVTLQTDGGSSAVTQCVYGKGGNAGAAGPVYSPTAPTNGGGTPNDVTANGVCDTITTATGGGTTGLDLKPGTIVKAGCGGNNGTLFCAGDPFTQFVTSLSGVGSNGVWVKGSFATAATQFTTPSGASINRWKPGEDQVFTMTLAFPDQGATTTTIAGAGTPNVSVGYDSIFQGGQVKFDLVWYLQQ